MRFFETNFYFTTKKSYIVFWAVTYKFNIYVYTTSDPTNSTAYYCRILSVS